MKSRLSAVIVMAAVGMCMGSAFAEGGIRSRSADSAYSDMVRDWNAQPSDAPSKQVMTRSEEAAHADMMRDWNAKMTGQPQKEAISQSEQARYIELMRGTFPLSNLAE